MQWIVHAMVNGNLQPFAKIDKSEGPAQIIGVTAYVNHPLLDQMPAYPPEREQWENDEYFVFLDKNSRHDLGHYIVWHLAIRRKDQQPANDWRDLQAIKTALVGPEYEALELYPAESRVIDVANETHLYVLRTENDLPVRVPIGRFGRREVNSVLVGQRLL